MLKHKKTVITIHCDDGFFSRAYYGMLAGAEFAASVAVIIRHLTHFLLRFGFNLFRRPVRIGYFDHRLNKIAVLWR